MTVTGAAGVLAASCIAIGIGAQAPSPPKLVPLDATGRITYFIADGIARSGYQAGDTQLAIWALDEWSRGAAGAIHFEPEPDEGAALIKIYWLPWAVTPEGRLMDGKMLPTTARRHPAALVFVMPATPERNESMARRMKKDPLLRDAIVYSTCLHEIGHALGLSHTNNAADIMWEGSGPADVSLIRLERYRRQLRTRDSIVRASWLSPNDVARVSALYGPPVNAR